MENISDEGIQEFLNDASKDQQSKTFPTLNKYVTVLQRVSYECYEVITTKIMEGEQKKLKSYNVSNKSYNIC